MESKSLNESIINIRVKLQNAKLKKSGYNEHSKANYFELSDFLPKLNELMLEEGINDRFYFREDYAFLDLQKKEETNTYSMPFVLFETPVFEKKDFKTGEVQRTKIMQDIQYLGALNTYYKRYLYLNAFGITDGEVIDSIDTSKLKETGKKEELKIQPTQTEIITKAYGDRLQKLLDSNNLEKLEDMSLTKASEICKEINKKVEEKKNGISKN